MNGRELLAWNVRKLRGELGLSQERLAADAGLDRAYLGGIERQAENPTIDVMEKLAAALSVEMEALLRRPGAKERPPQPLRPGRRPKA